MKPKYFFLPGLAAGSLLFFAAPQRQAFAQAAPPNFGNVEATVIGDAGQNMEVVKKNADELRNATIRMLLSLTISCHFGSR